MFAFSLNSSEGSQRGVPSAASVICTSLSSRFAASFCLPRGRRAAVHRHGSRGGGLRPLPRALVPPRAPVIRTSPSSRFPASFCLPRGRRAAVHRQGSAVDERRLQRAGEGGNLTHLLGLDAAFVRRPR